MEQKYCNTRYGKCDYRLKIETKDAVQCNLDGYCIYQLPKLNHHEDTDE